MALVPSPDETMLVEAVTALLARSAPVDAFRALRDEGGTNRFRRELWDEMAAVGLHWVARDFGFVGAALVMEAVGRNLAASPLASTVIAADILFRSGKEEPDPARITAVALASVDSLELTADGKLSGTLKLVPDARGAAGIVAAATAAGEVLLLLLDPDWPGITRGPVELIDSRDYCAIVCDAVAIGDDAIVARGETAIAQIARARDIGALLSAAELLGIAQECFERTVTYLKTREQFGVLIGTFQALQHRAARLWIDLQLAAAVTMKAARAFDAASDDAGQVIAHAKLRLAECAHKVIDEAVQMHGGIGVTDDLDIGLFMKRARVLGAHYGDAETHRERLAALRFGLPLETVLPR